MEWLNDINWPGAIVIVFALLVTSSFVKYLIDKIFDLIYSDDQL